MRKNNRNKGITLIALIITIIVMLILVAVTITIAVNGGLFNYAREAGVKTNEARDLEQEYANLADDLTYEDLIGRYSAELNPKGTIPSGGKYTIASTGDELEEGDKFPITVNTGDMYEYGDYAYKYNQWCDQDDWDSDYWEDEETQNGWGVRVKYTDKSEYGQILYSVNGKPVTNLYASFYDCSLMTSAPIIPNTVTSMRGTFIGCSSLKIASTIPNSVLDLNGTFDGCASLITAPTIPNRVTNMDGLFNRCIALTGEIIINANPSYYANCFDGTTKPITLTGSSTMLDDIASGYDNVQVAE